ncbi:hypothetical protein [Micromonospora sp. IBHARD004]|uniref:hypothetical protein n=1 Tax=Micromonospora sp. IBHARD004 TaxID=3457764 RepID=UPI00405823BC
MWTDDEALPAVGRHREELTAQGRALLIAPRPNRGLRRDLDREAFLRASAP